MATALAAYVLLRALGGTGFYPPFFRAAATPVFLGLGSHRIAELSPFESARGIYDTRLSLGTDAGGAPEYLKDILLDTLRVGYVPTALLAALVVATPIAWGRRLRSLAVGLLAVHAFVLLRFAITALYGFNVAELDGRPLLALGPIGTSLLERTTKVVSDDYHLGLVVPIVIWLAVTRAHGRYLSFFYPAEGSGTGVVVRTDVPGAVGAELDSGGPRTASHEEERPRAGRRVERHARRR